MFFDRNKFIRRLLRWYDVNRRDLPWRTSRRSSGATRPDPYHVLLSETMLQQTQVATVVPYYKRFLKAFPTVQSLASSDEQHVLRLWQGLGYYSRARNLRKCAIAIMRSHYGSIPNSVDDLIRLPGIGRYTAGAVASIAFNRRAPILDGNVSRVLCRLHVVRADPTDPRIRQQLWRHAADLLPERSRRFGDINSALMELGATVCTPRNPQCATCPVRGQCRAALAGVQESVPKRRKSRKVPLELRTTWCLCKGNRWLIEQRPPTGRWAGMWQFPTIKINGEHLAQTSEAKLLTTVQHQLTHRRYRFAVYLVSDPSVLPPGDGRKRLWVRLSDLSRYPLSKPQLQIARLLANPAQIPPLCRA